MDKSEFKVVDGIKKKYNASGFVVGNWVYVLDISIPTFITPVKGLCQPTEVFINDEYALVRLKDGLIDVEDSSIDEIEQIVIDFISQAKENDLQIGLVNSLISVSSSIISAFFVKYCLKMNVGLRIIPLSAHHSSFNMKEEMSLLPVEAYCVKDGYALFSSINEEESASVIDGGKLIPPIGYLKTGDPSLVIIKTIWDLKSNGLGLFITNISNSFIMIQCIRVCTSFKVPLKIRVPSFNEKVEDTIIEVIPKEDKK